MSQQTLINSANAVGEVKFATWLIELRREAVESFAFTPRAADVLCPQRRVGWYSYWREGYGPRAALEEDLFAPEAA